MISAAVTNGAADMGGSGFGYGFATVEDPSWTIADVLAATGGRQVSGPAPAALRSVVTDSRAVRPGDLFVALKGERFDGTDFALAAARLGAAAVLAERPVATCPAAVILVSDCRRALGDLAAWRRARLTNLRVLAVTGSSGKTTVKEMTAAILARCGKVIKTKGNFNNLIGLPLSLLPASVRHDFAVLEMGMNRPGEIARLTAIADPDIACINNVQPAHLSGLGSVEAVAAAKGELFAAGRPEMIRVVNLDDPLAAPLAGTGDNVLGFGRGRGAAVRATHLRLLGAEGVDFTLHVGGDQERVHLPLMGEHNVANALAAAALCHAAGVGAGEIAAGLADVRPGDKRLRVMTQAGGLTVINDAYNANPASMKAALKALSALGGRGRRVAALGDMLELGDFSARAHREIGACAAAGHVDDLFAVGEFAPEVAAGARGAGMDPARVAACADKEEMAARLRALMEEGRLGRGDVLLVKGSRGMRMEEILSLIGVEGV